MVKLFRDWFILTACGLALFAGWIHRYELYEMAGLDTSSMNSELEKTVVSLPIASAKPSPTPAQTSGTTVSLRKSADGHFWAEGTVNRGYVKFLVDTGASVVALTPEDAKKAGIKLRDLTYNSPVNTANGQTLAASVTLKSLAIGGVRVRNVEAIVVPEGLSVSLLGMSFLGKLQKVEATKKMMILRL